MRRGALLLMVILMTVCCPGCWDRVELEDIAWVQALGFDEGPGGYLSTTLEMVIPHGLGAGGAGGAASGGRRQPGFLTVTILSRTGYDAVDLAAVTLGRRLSLQHTQLLLFGESLARSDIRGLVSALDRSPEFRRSTLIAVAKGRAEDVLRVTMSPLEISPSRFIQTVIQQHPQTGLFEATRFSGFMSALETGSESSSCPIVAISREIEAGEGDAGFSSAPRPGERIAKPEFPPGFDAPGWTATQLEAGQVPCIGGGPVTIMGAAVFSGGRMVGDLNGDETACMLIVKGDFERGGVSIEDPQAPGQPEYSMSYEVRGRKSRVTATRSGDSVQINVEIHLEITYMSSRTQTDYTDPRNARIAEQAVGAYVKRILDTAISRTQRMKADVFGFGNKVRRTFSTWPEFDQFAWMSKYSGAVVKTAVSAKMTRYGLNLAPPRIPPGEVIINRAPEPDYGTDE